MFGTTSAKSSRQGASMSNRRPRLARCALAALGWIGHDCPLCGARGGPELLCLACSTSLPALPASCPRCALPAPGGTPCGSCLADPPCFDATTALWLYEFPCDRLVQALKYRARLELASFFAQALALRTGLTLEPRGARRIRNTIPQTELPYDERSKNIRGAFAARLDFSGKAVAVVDDVMTTGATLNELAGVLKAAGAASVHNLVIARSLRR